MNFKKTWMPKVILAKIFSEKATLSEVRFNKHLDSFFCDLFNLKPLSFTRLGTRCVFALMAMQALLFLCCVALRAKTYLVAFK